MNIIITMAGEGSRFKDIGFDIPKHEIIAKGKTLFEWSLLSLSDFFDENFCFIVRKGHYNFDFINNQCTKLKINNYEIIEISSLTSGQAETCMFADKYLEDDSEILIYNIDTYIEEGCLLKGDIKNSYEGFIPVFNGDGDKWSFIKLDENDNVIDVTEKIRISNLCSIGLYYFRSWNDFKNIYKKYRQEIIEKFKEVYIAPMYKYLIDKKVRIGYSVIDKKRVHILGTPADVQEFDSNYLEENKK